MFESMIDVGDSKSAEYIDRNYFYEMNEIRREMR